MGFYRERLLPELFERLHGPKAQLDPVRARILERAQGHVIELKSGCGANFFHYPDSITSLTTVEPNPGMNRRARLLIRHLGFPVDSRELTIDTLPMHDDSYDCAVVTMSLAFAENPAVVLTELRRVLKPTGVLLFMEWSLAEKASHQRWQRRLTPLTRRMFDGCRLNHPIIELVEDAGFTLEHTGSGRLRGWPLSMAHWVEGVARPGDMTP